MDFEPSPAQAETLAGLDTLLAAHGAPAQGFDAPLFARLRAEGRLDLARRSPAGALDAVLLVERLSRQAALTPAGLHALVLPLLFDPDPGGVAVLADERSEGPVPFGAEASLMVRYEGETAAAYRTDPSAARAVAANYVYPLAIPGPAAGTAVARAPAAAVRRRHRLALAAEAVGALDGALAMLTRYLTEREQFGRPIGAFQALQHRAAELAVSVEGARWLVRAAAWSDDDEDAALAAAYAAKAARRMAWEAHQLHGARGFTLAYGLHRHTLRLQFLSVAAGGAGRHAADAARLRWPSAA